MESLTLTIGIVASLLVFIAKPVWWLVIYCVVMAWYPNNLTIKLGTIDFSACRIIILALYANLFLRTSLLKGFKFIWLDKLVLIYLAATIVAGATTTRSLSAFLENRAGGIFDSALPYFAVRVILTTKEQYLTFLKAVLCLAVPLACLGLYEFVTGHPVAGPLRAYAAWGAVGTNQIGDMRYGFYRAAVTFPQPIMFGLFFAMLGPACVGLSGIRRYKLLCGVGIVFMGIGAVSSLSTGPLLVALLAGGFIASYRWRRYWKPILAIVIVMCGTVEIISNRHFYDVLGDSALKGSAVWYRSRLIDVVLFEGGMSGHWLTGYGIGADPGWGPKINSLRTDIVNQYLAVLKNYGLVGLVPFLAMTIGAIKKLVDAYKATILDSDKWLVWCLSAGMFGVVVGSMSVCLFGPPVTIYFMMLGLAGVMPRLVWQANRMIPQFNANAFDKNELF